MSSQVSGRADVRRNTRPAHSSDPRLHQMSRLGARLVPGFPQELERCRTGIGDGERHILLGDPAERLKMFQDVEKILVEDSPAVFIYHAKEIQLIKPWLKGQFVEPDNSGISAMHWPSYTTMSTVPAEMYIGADASSRD